MKTMPVLAEECGNAREVEPMALRRWIAGILCGLAAAALTATAVSAAVSTAPELPELSASGEAVPSGGSGSVSSVPLESDGTGPAASAAEETAQEDDRTAYLGVLLWAAVLVIIAIVAVIAVNLRKNPPGGAPPNDKGKLAKDSPETAAYKERLLSDQHYRRY